MLVVIPDALFGRIGAVLSALIVAFCLIGLTMHRDFYAGKPRHDFFCFYTNLSNLFVLIYFSLAAPRLYASVQLRPLIPHAEFALMMCIMLTFCVFHLLLFPAVRRQILRMERTREFYIVCADNLFVHYLVPWLVFIYWLLCSPGKARLSLPDALIWTVVPSIYIVLTFLRAMRGRIIEETGSPYPYPFLDVRVFGAGRVAAICSRLYSLSAGAGLAIVVLVRILAAAWGDGHELVLI